MSNPFLPPLTPHALLALNIGAPVWIIDHNGAAAIRFYAGMLSPGVTNRPLLSPGLNAPALAHIGPIWPTKVGALAELLDRARAEEGRAQAKVRALEAQIAAD